MKDKILYFLEISMGMVQNTIADLTPEELLMRPVPNANHPLWQLGHLLSTELEFIKMCDPTLELPVPEEFIKRFSKDQKEDFPSKETLVTYLTDTRMKMIEVVKGLTDADLDKPTQGPMAGFMPTLGHMLILQLAHASMHLGQIQVVRRKLGKPILF
jgi:uncharacterized damage-inducible protein DinB